MVAKASKGAEALRANERGEYRPHPHDAIVCREDAGRDVLGAGRETQRLLHQRLHVMLIQRYRRWAA